MKNIIKEIPSFVSCRHIARTEPARSRVFSCFRVLAVVLCLLIVSCTSPSSVADGSASETTEVSAKVIALDSVSACTVSVYVLSADSVPSLESASYLPHTTIATGESFVITVSQGEPLVLLFVCEDSLAAITRISPETGDERLNLPDIPLEETSRVRGFIRTLSGMDAVVSVPGTPYVQQVSNDTLNLSSLPADTLAMICTDPAGEGEPETLTVATTPGGVHVLDPVFLGAACTDIGCDTRIVRFILDANGLDTVGLSSIMGITNDNRVSKLYLDSMGLTVIPDAIRYLTEVTLLELNENRLDQAAAGIALMPTLTKLTLDGNDITTFPPHYPASGLERMTVNRCKICDPSPELGAWIDAMVHHTVWRKYQRCP